MKTARFLLAKGFTLVELLIVIALIGVLAVAVLAAINPLEQLNRARDTGMESDASQLLAAIDRYYASHEEFPWVAEDPSYDNDSAIGFVSAQDGRIGICDYDPDAGASDCDTEGVLLSTLELKSEFLNRKFALATTTNFNELLYVAKASGASTSVYACWVPLSNAKRADSNVSITLSDPARTSPCTPGGGGDLAWSDLDNSCLYCIPR